MLPPGPLPGSGEPRPWAGNHAPGLPRPRPRARVGGFRPEAGLHPPGGMSRASVQAGGSAPAGAGPSADPDPSHTREPHMTFTPTAYDPYDFANRRHIGPS